jgi:hypothetical protein
MLTSLFLPASVLQTHSLAQDISIATLALATTAMNAVDALSFFDTADLANRGLCCNDLVKYLTNSKAPVLRASQLSAQFYRTYQGFCSFGYSLDWPCAQMRDISAQTSESSLLYCPVARSESYLRSSPVGAPQECH